VHQETDTPPIVERRSQFNQYWGESAFRDSPFLFDCLSATMNMVAFIRRSKNGFLAFWKQ